MGERSGGGVEVLRVKVSVVSSHAREVVRKDRRDRGRKIQADRKTETDRQMTDRELDRVRWGGRRRGGEKN